MIYYSIIVILLAAIDMLRMKRTWGKVNNINHWLSYLLAAIGIIALWLTIHGWAITWVAIPFIVGCVALRGMFYDIALNMLVNFFIIPRAIDYISSKSNSLNEQRLTKIPFWWRRAAFVGLLIIVLIVNHFL